MYSDPPYGLSQRTHCQAFAFPTSRSDHARGLRVAPRDGPTRIAPLLRLSLGAFPPFWVLGSQYASPVSLMYLSPVLLVDASSARSLPCIIVDHYEQLFYDLCKSFNGMSIPTVPLPCPQPSQSPPSNKNNYHPLSPHNRSKCSKVMKHDNSSQQTSSQTTTAGNANGNP